jgi:hypothetical protein
MVISAPKPPSGLALALVPEIRTTGSASAGAAMIQTSASSAPAQPGFDILASEYARPTGLKDETATKKSPVPNELGGNFSRLPSSGIRAETNRRLARLPSKFSTIPERR